MLLSFWLFEASFTSTVTITFTALIFSEILNVFTTLHRWSKIILLCQFLTVVVYLASIIFLRDIIDVSIIDVDFIKNVAIITLFSWGPMQIGKWLRMRWSPTEAEKIMRAMKTEKDLPPTTAMLDSPLQS